MQNTLSGFEGLANLVRCGNYILIWVVGYTPGTINTHNNTSVKNRLPGLWEQREDKSQLDLKDPRQDDNMALMTEKLGACNKRNCPDRQQDASSDGFGLQCPCANRFITCL